MDHRSELQVRRDALEDELLALESDLPGDGQHSTMTSGEKLQRVDGLLVQLGVVNKALSERGGSEAA